MKEKLTLEKILLTIERADLAACSDAVEFINSLDLYQYSQEELKCISEFLSSRLPMLLRIEIKPGLGRL